MFDLRSARRIFVVGKVALGQVLLRVLRVSHGSIIPPMLRNLLPLHILVTRRRNGRILGTFQIRILCRTSGSARQIPPPPFIPTRHGAET